MFDKRSYIGMPFYEAKEALQNMGYTVYETENTQDDRHKYDTKLVVRVDIKDKIVTLITAKFLMNI